MVRSFTVLDGIGKSLDPRWVQCRGGRSCVQSMKWMSISACALHDPTCCIKHQNTPPPFHRFIIISLKSVTTQFNSIQFRFDISEISAPYARELLLETQPQFAKFADDFMKRAQNQNRAVVNLFRGPNQIEDIAGVMRRLEGGDLKLRVRALEAERALNR